MTPHWSWTICSNSAPSQCETGNPIGLARWLASWLAGWWCSAFRIQVPVPAPPNPKPNNTCWLSDLVAICITAKRWLNCRPPPLPPLWEVQAQVWRLSWFGRLSWSWRWTWSWSWGYMELRCGRHEEQVTANNWACLINNGGMCPLPSPPLPHLAPSQVLL